MWLLIVLSILLVSFAVSCWIGIQLQMRMMDYPPAEVLVPSQDRPTVDETELFV